MLNIFIAPLSRGLSVAYTTVDALDASSLSIRNITSLSGIAGDVFAGTAADTMIFAGGLRPGQCASLPSLFLPSLPFR